MTKRNRGKDPGDQLVKTFFGFRSALVRLLRTFVGPDDADDIISETFLRTYQNFGDSEIAYPKAFLYKTARNLALNHIAKQENRFNHSLEDFPDSDVYLASEELESRIEAQEKFRLFCSVVESLSPKCRRAFVLKRVQGWSLKDIANEMDISASTVEKHVAKGVLLCADALKRKGYDLEGIATSKNIQDSSKSR